MKINKFLILSFLTGFSLMVIELTATRIISPLVGNSIYTWTSVIAVVLFGSSLGNHVGGIIIDRNNNNKNLPSLAYFYCSFFILFIPFLAYVSKGFISYQLPLWLIVVLLCMWLFLIPAFMLGMIYPMLFKQYALNVEKLGAKAGSFSAFGALGSILGTLLTGFVFIGYLGSKETLLCISFILFACGVFLYHGKGTIKIWLLIYVVFITSLYLLNFHLEKGVLYQKESSYYNMKIKDGENPLYGKVRTLYLDVDSHSIESISGKDIGIYTNIAPVFSVFKKEVRDILVIGGGSFELSENFGNVFEKSTVTTIELDPEVVSVAKKYFHTPDEIINNTVIEDGRVFINKNQNKYDIIFSDAYNSLISVPWHLTTKEFFVQTKSRLNSEGVFAVNFIGSLNGESAYYESLMMTFSSVFDNFHIFAYGNSFDSVQNIVLVGINSNEKQSDEMIRQKIMQLPKDRHLAVYLKNKSDLYQRQNSSVKKIVFKDDFAPTDRLMMPVIDEYFKAKH